MRGCLPLWDRHYGLPFRLNETREVAKQRLGILRALLPSMCKTLGLIPRALNVLWLTRDLLILLGTLWDLFLASMVLAHGLCTDTMLKLAGQYHKVSLPWEVLSRASIKH